MKLNDEQFDALQAAVLHHGHQFVIMLLEERIDVMKKGMLSVPLDKDPEKSALILLQERMKVEGAMKLRDAFLAEIKKVKEKT